MYGYWLRPKRDLFSKKEVTEDETKRAATLRAWSIVDLRGGTEFED